MLNRYLGNKTDLLGPILQAVRENVPPGGSVCDIFSGTLSVSLELKRQGYRVIANDINHFSAVIGEAFLLNNEVPSAPTASLLPRELAGELRPLAEDWLESLEGAPGFEFLALREPRSRYRELLTVLLFLNRLEDTEVPSSYHRTDFLDTYTESGRNSEFVNRRGSRGRRKFFSPENGKTIDRILCVLRYWWRERIISSVLHCLLLSVLLRAVEKVSNTQGTYHGFIRRGPDARSLNALQLEAPALDVVLKGGMHRLGRAQDSLEFVRTLDVFDAIYIDPPYNFRQYTSYYFLPNLICRYTQIEDLDRYFADVRFMRGQNMDDDFVSPFCKKKLFIPSLKTLIERANTRTVIFSYFSGRNHWGEFDEGANGIGLKLLSEFFRTGLFVENSLVVRPINRANYRSYGGYRARDVAEYVFIAEKAVAPSVLPGASVARTSVTV